MLTTASECAQHRQAVSDHPRNGSKAAERASEHAGRKAYRASAQQRVPSPRRHRILAGSHAGNSVQSARLPGFPGGAPLTKAADIPWMFRWPGTAWQFRARASIRMWLCRKVRRDALLCLGRCGKASSLKRYIKKFDFKRWNMGAVPHLFCGHWHQRRIHELSRSTPEPITMREASVLWAAKREAAKETA
jgi:hypothetical protein